MFDTHRESFSPGLALEQSYRITQYIKYMVSIEFFGFSGPKILKYFIAKLFLVYFELSILPSVCKTFSGFCS